MQIWEYIKNFSKLHFHFIPATLSLAAVGVLATGLMLSSFGGFSGEIKTSTSNAGLESFYAYPNPILSCDGTGGTTLYWSIDSALSYELVEGESGSVVAEGLGSGSFELPFVTNGAKYQLKTFSVSKDYDWVYEEGKGWVSLQPGEVAEVSDYPLQVFFDTSQCY